MRFSSDPTPYKPYFSVTWSRTGRKGPYAHYYLHIQPNGESFFGGNTWLFLISDVTDDQLGGGYYSSDNATLACMREDIDQQPHQFKSVLMNDNLRKTFFPGMKDEKKVVAAFCKMSGDNALKTKPKVSQHPGFGNHGLARLLELLLAENSRAMMRITRILPCWNFGTMFWGRISRMHRLRVGMDFRLWVISLRQLNLLWVFPSSVARSLLTES